jgi:general secretion pathway protein J
LELLVAMTLLALLTVMLSGGLRFGSRVWERGEVKDDQSAGVREFLRRSVEGMLPEPRDIDDPTSGLLVSGSATSLEFTTRTMAEAAMVGLYLLQLRQEEDAQGTRFVASWRRLPPGGSPSGETTELETRTLLNGVKGVDFAYMSPSGEWSSSWADSPQLPRYVRIRLQYPDGDARRWPELVVAPRISADLSCLYGAELPICKGAVR